MFSLTTYAQEYVIEDFTQEEFTGLRTLSTGHYYLSYVSFTNDQTKKSFHLHLLNENLEAISKIELEIPSDAQLNDIKAVNSNYALLFSSSSQKLRSVYLFDQEGTLLKENTLQDKSIDSYAANYPAYLLTNGEALYLVANKRNKKYGYEVAALSATLEPTAVYSVYPEKKALFPMDFIMEDDAMVILELTSGYSESRYFEFRLKKIDLSSGELLWAQTLWDEDKGLWGVPYGIHKSPNGGYVTGGIYEKKNRLSSTNAEGVFSAQLSATGELKTEFVRWKEVEKKMRVGTAAFWGGKTKSYVRDLVLRSDGSFTLIVENFRDGNLDMSGDKPGALGQVNAANNVLKGLSPTQTPEDYKLALTVSNYGLFYFNNEATLSSFETQYSPASITYLASPDGSEYSSSSFQDMDLAISSIMAGYMPYRFTVKHHDKYFLVRNMKYDETATERIFFNQLDIEPILDTASIYIKLSTLESSSANEINLNDHLGKFGESMNKIGRHIEEKTYHSKWLKQFGGNDTYAMNYYAEKTIPRIQPSNEEGKFVSYLIEDQLSEDPAQAGIPKLKVYFIDYGSKLN